MNYVKMLGETDDTYIIGGYGVVYGGADLEGEAFTPDTDFQLDLVPQKPIYYDHAMNKATVDTRLGYATAVTPDDIGLFVEAELAKSEAYTAAVMELVQAGKVGFSSGTIGHLARRSGKSIKTWPIVEFSLTTTPAEPRTLGVERIKSLYPDLLPAEGGQETAAATQEGRIEIVKMERETMTEQLENDSAIEALETQLAAMSQQFGELVTLIESNAPLRDAGYVAPDSEGNDRAGVKSLGDFAIAIARGNTKRLASVYGATKAHNSQTGESLGYAIPEGFQDGLNKTINLNSGIAQLIDRQPVGQPSGRMPIPDFTTAPTAGSGDTAEAGGVGTNSRSEGGAYTEETGKIEQIRWQVFDALSGYVKTSKELVAYAPAVEALLRRYIATAMVSKTEFYVLRGNGVDQPLGILNWGGAIGITPDTNSVFAVADADEMLSRFLQGGTQPVWLIHPSIIPDIAGMERGTGAGTFQANIAQSLATTLHGFPIVRSQHLPQANSSGCVILADLSMWTMFEYGGMYLDFSEHADFLNGNLVWRFGQLIDGKPMLPGAVTLADPQGSYTLSPFVYFND
jgi:HK97 family phage major capsid protein